MFFPILLSLCLESNTSLFYWILVLLRKFIQLVVIAINLILLIKAVTTLSLPKIPLFKLQTSNYFYLYSNYKAYT